MIDSTKTFLVKTAPVKSLPILAKENVNPNIRTVSTLPAKPAPPSTTNVKSTQPTVTYPKSTITPNTVSGSTGSKRVTPSNGTLSKSAPTTNTIKRPIPTPLNNRNASIAAKPQPLPAKRVSTIPPCSSIPTTTATTNRKSLVPTSKPNLPTTAKPPLSHARNSTWDIRTRLQAMEDMTKSLREQVYTLSSQLGDRETQLEVESQVKSTLEQDLSSFHHEIQSANDRNRQLLQQMDEAQALHQTRVSTLESQNLLVQSRLESSELNLRTARSELQRMQVENQMQVSLVQSRDAELASVRQELALMTQTCSERDARIQHLESNIDQQAQQILELELQSREDEQLRRQLHNSVQELKGNIRVFCRVRHLLSGEASQDSLVRFNYSKYDPSSLEIVQKLDKDVTGCKSVPDKHHVFKFDRVFNGEATQSMVFKEISQLVQSALDGYNACIFAYGQTGSGKTYTMEGPDVQHSSDESQGIISRAVMQIFASSTKLKEKGWDFTMTAGFLEIYNETLRDLLDPKHADTKKCEIKHDAETGVTSVINQTNVTVRSPSQVNELLQIASRNRVVAATQLNARSSRSHSVFQLRIFGQNRITSQTIEGILNMIDLAGSERVSQSGVTGERFTETKSINKSLSCLSDVISSLANKDKHIPYRNSKLTYLLQNSLGGNAKTLMFVNVSPTLENINETLNSLRFASRVNACEIGTARKTGKIEL